jgi:hypothetical protein
LAAACEVEERKIALSRVAVGIASVRCWWRQKRSTRGRERAAGEDECERAKTKTPPQRRPVD